MNEYLAKVATGQIPGHAIHRHWGVNRAVPAGTASIWSKGGTHVWNDDPEDVLITSDSAEDGPGGTGWIIASVEYIDTNYTRNHVEVIMNGATGVTITDCRHIVKMDCQNGDSEVGSSEVNVGNITATGVTSGNIYNYVAAGDGATLAFFSIVQGGHTMLVGTIKYSASTTGGSPILTFKFFIQKVGYGKELIRTDTMDTAVEGQMQIDYIGGFVMIEETRWWVEVTSDKAGAEVNAEFSGIEIKN